MTKIPLLLLAAALALAADARPLHARGPALAGPVAEAAVAEAVKGTMQVVFEGLQRAFPKAFRFLGPRPAVVQASVEQTYHRLDRTRRYPHQPLVRELYVFREMKSGGYFTRRVWTNGVLGLDEGVVVPPGNPDARPGWAPPLLLNHLTRDCGMTLDGARLEDRSEETYEVVVRCQVQNWPRSVNAARGFVSLDLPHLALANRCLEPDQWIEVPTLRELRMQPNGTARTTEWTDVPVLFDVLGNGISSPLRPRGEPNQVEAHGQPPRITRLATTPTPSPSSKAKDR